MEINREYIDLIQELLPVERVMHLLEIEKLLVDLRYEDHYPLLQRVLNNGQEFSDLDAGEYVYKIYVDQLHLYLTKVGVTCVFDTDISTLIMLATGLHSLTHPDNTDILNLLVEMEESDTNYMLASMLAELTELSIPRWYHILERVDSALIVVLKSISESGDLINEANEEVDDIKKRFAYKFKDISSEIKDPIIKHINALPIVFNYQAKLLDWTDDASTLAIKLSMLSVLSGAETDESQRDIITDIVENTVDDFNRINSILLRISEFYNGELL